MFQFYQNAFHARKTYEDTPPDSDDIHIMMDIYGVENLIGPGVAPGRDVYKRQLHVRPQLLLVRLCLACGEDI